MHTFLPLMHPSKGIGRLQRLIHWLNWKYFRSLLSYWMWFLFPDLSVQLNPLKIPTMRKLMPSSISDHCYAPVRLDYGKMSERIDLYIQEMILSLKWGLECCYLFHINEPRKNNSIWIELSKHNHFWINSFFPLSFWYCKVSQFKY